jgi:protein-S-isoprenylcysteine O-methyltransferase Ste14
MSSPSSPRLILPAVEEFRPRCFNAIHRSLAFDWATRIAVASVFVLMLFSNVSGIIQAASGEITNYTLLSIASRASSALFVSLVVATTLTRLPPIRKAAGVEPRIAAMLGTFLLTALAMLPKQELPPIALAFSCALVVTGMLTSFVVLRWLGKAFSIMAEARRLVTHGPYRFVRHPLYVCEELAVIGTFIQVVSPLALIIFIVHAVFQFRRMAYEEQVLTATFPEYENYAQRTPRLLPLGWIRSAA